MHASKPVPVTLRNPLADRRFAYARAAADDGAWQEAADVFRQALELAPDWVAAWIALGEAQQASGDPQAMDAFQEALRLDPSDSHGAALRLAALEPGPIPAAAPQAYVTALFDAYAERFDTHLTKTLAYQGPMVLVEALREVCDRPFSHAIDLGCGTGLGGVALRPFAHRLTGVDLSPKMVAKAEAKNLYDRLAVGDITGFLRAEPPASADLVAAVDVFVYIGDLTPVLTAAAQVLREGGLLAFTAQRGDTGITVGPDMRFSHGLATIEDSLARCGYTRLILREERSRREKGFDVPGLVAVARRR